MKRVVKVEEIGEVCKAYNFLYLSLPRNEIDIKRSAMLFPFLYVLSFPLDSLIKG